MLSSSTSPRAPAPWHHAAVLLAAACVAAVGLSRLVYPFDSGHFEGGLWAPAQLIASGQNPYDLAHAERPPFVMAPYGPLFYTLLAPGLSLLGPQFWCGRALALLALVACCLSIARLPRLVTEESDGSRAAWLGVALFLSSMPVPYWAGLQRPDFPALALSLWAIGAALSPRPRPMLAGVLCALALLCRQTAMLPLLLGVAWLWSRDRRSALALAGSFAVVMAASVGILNGSSRGGFVWQAWILSSGSAKSLDEALLHAALLFASPSAFVVILIFATAPKYLRRPAQSEAQSRLKCLGAYTLASSALAFATSSRHGSNANYWLEPCAAAAVAAPALLARVAGARWNSRLAWGAAFGLCGLSALVMGSIMRGEEEKRWRSLAFFRATAAQVRKLPANEPVFSLFPELATSAGRPYWFNDFLQYDGRSPRHRALFEAALRERKVAAILSDAALRPGYVRLPIRTASPRQLIHFDVRRDLLKYLQAEKAQPTNDLRPNR